MLVGANIYLRALEPSDLDLLYEWENNLEVWRISDTQVPFSRFQLEQYISSNQDIYSQKQVRFVICALDNHIPVGCIDLFDYNPNHKRVGIGILIADKEWRKKGYGSESLSILLEYADNILDCENTYCNMTVDNEGSQALFLKAGFETVGVKKRWIREGKEYKDEIMMQRERPNS